MSRLNRRSFGTQLGTGIGMGLGASSLALQSLLGAEGQDASTASHHRATARHVIFLFMSGGPSQVDTFDPKPALAKLAGQDVPESIAQNVPSD